MLNPNREMNVPTGLKILTIPIFIVIALGISQCKFWREPYPAKPHESQKDVQREYSPNSSPK